MRSDSAQLARSITRSSSKQSYYTALVLVDRDLVDDCCMAYAYFRWADDVVDRELVTRDDRIEFIESQKDLVENLYNGRSPETDLNPEEQILVELVRNDRGQDSLLRSYIDNFFAVLELDAHRKGRPITSAELDFYSERLGIAVTDAIQYFVNNGYPYPEDPIRYRAAEAAHITHMLRDLVSDLDEGYINVPAEFLAENDLDPHDVEDPHMRAWVRERVNLARQYFKEGSCYLEKVEVLRCKIAGHLYTRRFELVLDVIEKDGYVLRTEYKERRKLRSWLRMGVLALSVSLGDLFRRNGMREVDCLPDSGDNEIFL